MGEQEFKPSPPKKTTDLWPDNVPGTIRSAPLSGLQLRRRLSENPFTPEALRFTASLGLEGQSKFVAALQVEVTTPPINYGTNGLV